MALTSPGVQVSVIDESFYTPAEPGTVPMIFVASAENKTNAAGTGIAQGTLKENAGVPYLLTSQRDLADTFGDPVFKVDNNNNPIHAGELNEYGLQAAYSLLGVSNRAYVVRADIDLDQLTASAEAPTANPAAGTYWFDTANTAFGIFEWNGAAATTTGGQSFSVKNVTVLTDANQVTGGVPKTSVGAVGDYAIVATTNLNKLYYKSAGNGNVAGGGTAVDRGEWVLIGSESWTSSFPTITGTETNPVTIAGDQMTINSTVITASGTTVATIASDINALAITGITARANNAKLELYSDGPDIVITAGGALLDKLGLTAGTYKAPGLAIAAHTSVPEWKATDTSPRPTGSVWVKTTEPNAGARWRVKVFNGDTELFDEVTAPIYRTNAEAIYNLDRAGGGANLSAGDLYVKADVAEDTDATAQFKIYKRENAGPTTLTTDAISTQLTSGSFNFSIQETITTSSALQTARSVAGTVTGAATDADVIAGEINGAGFTNIVAEVDANNKIIIRHTLGGDFRINDTSGHITEAGVVAGTTANVYAPPAGDATNEFQVSNWKALTHSTGEDAPTALAADGTLWYSSVVDEADIMYHNGSNWVGYRDATAWPSTDSVGPIVSATEPTKQNDGTSSLVTGDIWISTADLDNYPLIYVYNAQGEWILRDNTDQTTENGVLFADARWSDAGANSDAADIEDLLTSNYLDPDAPDPALYPKGMLLFNLRRSGFNVKRFERNYIDLTADNGRGSDDSVSMSSYYPHRWVTESANQEDGSGSFGRHAQRKVVVQAMQALVNSNDAIRDDEARVFNLMATPGYPELIGEMISLNYDRGLSAFIVGDSPFRLTPDATTLNNWGQNVATAVEDNEQGLVSRDEYLGVFYPAGFTSDNFGNNVVVPPSHMILRTIALSDQVSFPWFAPAGTRRGGITNATATGYISDEGEFVSIALNEGQRDTLYSVNVNPVTFLNGAGLVNYGQKTRARNASSLDRINVARLVVYLRSQLNKLAKPYIFEPNDKITRDEIKQAAESLLLELVGQRALYDFLVVCDESNNTPNRIDRNELYLDIAIEPVKAVEFIYIPLRLKNTGEIAGL